jgi:hypothetical protein|tara:strand:+ start:8883 stop:9626 length:744 start_codon:yes stop_codon:yes gene_type:complete
MAEVKFPTEVVDLPSRGLLYPKDNPMSSGKIEIRYMTAKDEDILTSPNLIKQGIVVDKLLESIVVDKSINLNEMLLGDKNALLIAARILAYGKDYKVKVGDEDIVIDLTKLKDKFLDEKLVVNGNLFEYELPMTKVKVQFKFITSAEENSVQKEVEGLMKISGGVSFTLTTRMKHQIVSVGGNADRAYINDFVDNQLLSRDAISLRGHIEDISPDVDMSWEYTDSTGERRETTVPMTVQFLWPTARI